MSVDPYEETWRRIHDQKINLTIAELMPELKSLRDEKTCARPGVSIRALGGPATIRNCQHDHPRSEVASKGSSRRRYG